jgi:hypothetical protein
VRAGFGSATAIGTSEGRPATTAPREGEGGDGRASARGKAVGARCVTGWEVGRRVSTKHLAKLP